MGKVMRALLTNPPPQYWQRYHKRTCFLYHGGVMPVQRAFLDASTMPRDKKGSKRFNSKNDDCALPIYVLLTYEL